MRNVTLADGMTTIAVDDESLVFGYWVGDIITADERHAKWVGKEVEVLGRSTGRLNEVLWGQVIGEKTADCCHNPEGLSWVRRGGQPAA